MRMELSGTLSSWIPETQVMWCDIDIFVVIKTQGFWIKLEKGKLLIFQNLRVCRVPIHPMCAATHEPLSLALHRSQTPCLTWLG